MGRNRTSIEETKINNYQSRLKQDFNDLVRRSIRKDFAKANFKRNGRVPKTPHPKDTKRVLSISEKCEYYKYRKFFNGKIVRIVEPGGINGVWVEFVRDADRVNLNNAAGWSNNKKTYLLHGAKFDD